MKKTILFITLNLISFSALSVQNYPICKSWDTFCKSPKQITATKCRLGVPVKHEQCLKLGISNRYLVRGGGSLVESMPVSNIHEGFSNE